MLIKIFYVLDIFIFVLCLTDKLRWFLKIVLYRAMAAITFYQGSLQQ
jgi:hypothetical protein